MARIQGGKIPGHIQGYDFGKAEHTLCGIPYGRSWDFEVGKFPPSQFDNCKRCKKIVTKLAKDTTP